jgi:hypothetical protein
MSLLLAFAAGFVTWSLALYRGLALERRQIRRLSCAIFVDELCAIGVGVWLARVGTLLEIVLCALGGATAAWIMLRWGSRDEC